MKKEMKTKNGHDFTISPADFESAMNLQNAILTELSTSKLDMNVDVGENLESSGIMGEILPMITKVGASKEIQSAIFDCLKVCKYQGHRITRATFDDYEARGDYYEIAIECAKFNLQPFFGGLLSGLNSNLKTLTESLK